jgi:hypothetical protein
LAAAEVAEPFLPASKNVLLNLQVSNFLQSSAGLKFVFIFFVFYSLFYIQTINLSFSVWPFSI